MKRKQIKHILGLAGLLATTPIATHVTYSKLQDAVIHRAIQSDQVVKDVLYGWETENLIEQACLLTGRAYLKAVELRCEANRRLIEERESLEDHIITDKNRNIFKRYNQEQIKNKESPLSFDGHVMTSFTKDQCPPCVEMKPLFEILKREYPEITFQTVHENRAIYYAFDKGPCGWPTIFFSDGNFNLGKLRGVPSDIASEKWITEKQILETCLQGYFKK